MKLPGRRPKDTTPCDWIRLRSERKENGCLIWLGASQRGGTWNGHEPTLNLYGRISVRGKLYYTHRLILEERLGRPLKPGHQADHFRPCDTLCCEESHLKEVTYQVNCREGGRKGAELTNNERWGETSPSEEMEW